MVMSFLTINASNILSCCQSSNEQVFWRVLDKALQVSAYFIFYPLWLQVARLAGDRRKSGCRYVDVHHWGIPLTPQPPHREGDVLTATTPSPNMTDGGARTSCRSSQIMVDWGPAVAALCIFTHLFLFLLLSLVCSTPTSRLSSRCKATSSGHGLLHSERRTAG